MFKLGDYIYQRGVKARIEQCEVMMFKFRHIIYISCFYYLQLNRLTSIYYSVLVSYQINIIYKQL